jgi:hypothetical protein
VLIVFLQYLDMHQQRCLYFFRHFSVPHQTQVIALESKFSDLDYDQRLKIPHSTSKGKGI